MLTSPILEDIVHIEGIPDPGFPFTIFLVDHHVFSNCDSSRRFHLQRRERGWQQECCHCIFGWEVNGLTTERET